MSSEHSPLTPTGESVRLEMPARAVPQQQPPPQQPQRPRKTEAAYAATSTAATSTAATSTAATSTAATSTAAPATDTSTTTHTFFAQLRATEYSRLDAAGHAYLDYTGAGLYAASQIDAHHRRLQREVLGNPHSENPASMESTVRIERARRRVLDFLHAAADEYEVVFTANASAALRPVAEAFPFERGSRFVLTADNHNSVNGIRCHAGRAGAVVRYVPLERTLRSVSPEPFLDDGGDAPRLFVFPAQSNYRNSPAARWTGCRRAVAGTHCGLEPRRSRTARRISWRPMP